ncbi:hypothetical protein FA95DRAFT_345425 [Auriscalpium vulgare]|uniref:Uncharacterized protein n=1 Tax=Auriscalpium vulgare TaxID=40419 RepID=A0ACB8RHU3_9AGAM|nr:hypothetical protein FA95DRAFT_345425 [Auriscalpium vulgare]
MRRARRARSPARTRGQGPQNRHGRGCQSVATRPSDPARDSRRPSPRLSLHCGSSQSSVAGRRPSAHHGFCVSTTYVLRHSGRGQLHDIWTSDSESAVDLLLIMNLG